MYSFFRDVTRCCLLLVVVGCQTGQPSSSESTPRVDDAHDSRGTQAAKHQGTQPKTPAKGACVVYAPSQSWPELSAERLEREVPQVVLCPTLEALESAAAQRDLNAVKRVAGAEGVDPVQTRTGLEIYEHAVEKLSRGARLTPMLFFETPPLSAEQVDLLASDERARKALHAMYEREGRSRWDRFAKIIKAHKKDKSYVRKLLLRSGFLYEEDPFSASMIWRRVSLSHFFSEDEPTVYLRRGATVYTLKRDGDNYLIQGGPRDGAVARLLVFDQVSTRREDLEPRYGWDLDAFRRPFGLQSIQVKGYTPDLIEADVVMRRGDRLQGRVFLRDGRRILALLVPEEERGKRITDLDRDRRDQSIASGILQAGEMMVDERLRFDEPRNEQGQEDGKLRNVWLNAYARGSKRYFVNGAGYTVFTRRGRPNIPQVCIDFVVDAPERWSGRWWTSQDAEKRMRTEGFLNFDGLVENRRRVRSILDFARADPRRVDLLSFPAERRVPFRQRDAFYAMTDGLSGEVFEGDILVIYGLRDDGRNHYHSFYVHTSDPMRNRPILMMGNAGFARLQTWDSVMRSAPRRSLHHRVRLRPEWIDSLRHAARKVSREDK